MAGICGEVQLVTLLGEINSREEFILQKLKPNVKTKFFYREEGPTVIKRRYIDRYLNQKLFEINYLKNEYINEKCESAVVEYLKKQTGKYDLILVPDFGHGFITDKIIKMIKQVSGKVAVNTQTNAANAGYNMITKYQNPNCVCLDEVEARWATQERFSDIEMVIRRLSKALKTNYLIITMGKSGSIGIDKKGFDRRFKKARSYSPYKASIAFAELAPATLILSSCIGCSSVRSGAKISSKSNPKPLNMFP